MFQSSIISFFNKFSRYVISIGNESRIFKSIEKIFTILLSFFWQITTLYKEGNVYRRSNLLVCKFEGYLFGSCVWDILINKEKIQGYLKNSTLTKWLQKSIYYVFEKLMFVNTRFRYIFNSSVCITIIERISKHIPKLLGLFISIQFVTPHSYWHNYYGIAVILFLIIIYFYKSIVDSRYVFKINKIDIMLWIYLLAMILSLITSLDFSDSVRVFIYNLVPMILVLIMVNVIKTKKELDMVISFLIAGTILMVLYGVLQAIAGVPVDPSLIDVGMGTAVGRIYSTLANPNNYAEYLVLVMPLFIAVFLNTKNGKVKFIVGIMGTIALLNLVLTYSRSGWIAFFLATVIFLVLKDIRFLPLFSVLVLVGIPFIPISIIGRLSTLGKDSSSMYRIGIWQGANEILKDFWISGIGLGPKPFMKLFPTSYTNYHIPPHSHKLFLQIWLELGIIGIASFLGLILRMIKRGVKIIAKKSNVYQSNIVIALISSLVGIFFIGMVEYIWFYPRVMNMFWIDVGLLMCVLNLKPLEDV